jgi:hypothetical protein
MLSQEALQRRCARDRLAVTQYLRKKAENEQARLLAWFIHCARRDNDLDALRALKKFRATRDRQVFGGQARRSEPVRDQCLRNQRERGNRLSDRDEFQRIFDESSSLSLEHLKVQLAHRHMLVLADHFEEWSLDKRWSPEKSAKL